MTNNKKIIKHVYIGIILIWIYLTLFFEIKKENKKTTEWIQVSGTNINYPFVQTINNYYYLTHAFDNTYNDARWVFFRL